jgi:hypothetical protein
MKKAVLSMHASEPKKPLRADRPPTEGFVTITTAILSQNEAGFWIATRRRCPRRRTGATNGNSRLLLAAAAREIGSWSAQIHEMNGTLNSGQLDTPVTICGRRTIACRAAYRETSAIRSMTEVPVKTAIR